MRPQKPLPFGDDFNSVDDYIDALLDFVTTSDLFQLFAGGIHILDFWTSDPGLFYDVIPPDWQPFLFQCEPLPLVDLLVRQNLDALPAASNPDQTRPPESLIRFIRDVKHLCLDRSFTPSAHSKLPVLSIPVAVGMKAKKVHEVTHFASYVDSLADYSRDHCGHDISHLLDLGSGQNYLGRTLASPGYGRRVVAVESRPSNIAGAIDLDLKSRIVNRVVVNRNKKAWRHARLAQVPVATEPSAVSDAPPMQVSQHLSQPSPIQYIVGRVASGDLSNIIDAIPSYDINRSLGIMGVSIHSCGDLSHHAIRSLVMNPDIRTVAIIGCCYNLLSERLGPPDHCPFGVRPSLKAINGSDLQQSDRYDPQGFPMSETLATYGARGIRLNVTARMMACQAVPNWVDQNSLDFFKRHAYRAILQRIFLDRGVISRVSNADPSTSPSPSDPPVASSTSPIIVGSLRRSCYTSLGAYVRGAVARVSSANGLDAQVSARVRDRMGTLSDDDVDRYERSFLPRAREISAAWTLMAFAAQVTEALIVVDRWLFLHEHPDIVDDCWVETAFEYRESPRNLVVIPLLAIAGGKPQRGKVHNGIN